MLRYHYVRQHELCLFMPAYSVNTFSAAETWSIIDPLQPCAIYFNEFIIQRSLKKPFQKKKS